VKVIAPMPIMVQADEIHEKKKEEFEY